MNIALLGPPGTGKGTLGKLITTRAADDSSLGGTWIEFDAGTRLREYAYSGETPDQLTLRALLEDGQLAPTDLMMRFYREWIRTHSADDRHILSSGIPRKDQADYFVRDIESGAYSCEALIRLVVPEGKEDVLARRLEGRRTCVNKECGEIFHNDFRPPAKEGVCDSCGSEVRSRTEDMDPEARRRRIRIQTEAMAPAAERLRAAGVPVFDIDATQDIEVVYREAQTIIRRRLLAQRRPGMRR